MTESNNIAKHEDGMKMAEQLCADLGVRFTPQRRQVFEIIWKSQKALTASEIMDAMGNHQPPITYRALDFLMDVGLIHHIGSLNAFAWCPFADHQPHVCQILVCRACKSVEGVLADEGLKKLSKQASSAGFLAEDTHVEMVGLCEKCQKEQD